MSANLRAIIAGVDETPESARAAALGALLAERAGATCVPVCAVPDYETIFASYGMDALSPAAVRQAFENDHKAVAAALQAKVPRPIIENLRVLAGRPATVLRDEATRLHAGLIILGHRERRGPRFGDSLVTQLLRTTDVPVLVTDRPATAIRRILVALDLSYASEATLDGALAWSRHLGAELRALHVIEPMPPVPFATVQLSEEYYRADELLRENGLWARIDERAVDKVIRYGYPATLIASEAMEWQADLIIMGSHGRGWAERLFIGSAAEQLSRKPVAPTLVIPVARPDDVAGRALMVGRLPWEDANVAAADALVS